MILGTYHQCAGRAEVITEWLNKRQAAGQPAFAIGEDLYSTAGRYSLLGRDTGPYSIRRDHDLSKEGFQRATERNYYDGDTATVWLSANDLAVAYVVELHAVRERERAEAQRQAEEQQRAQEAKYARQSAFRTELEDKLTGAKFKKATAALAMPNGEPFKTVTGVAFKGLLVHRTPQGEGYDVSHVISGKRANSKSFTTQAEGKAAVVRLVELGNWERTGDEIQADRPFCVAAAQLMLHISVEGVYSVK